MPDNTTPVQQWEYRIHSGYPLNLSNKEEYEKSLDKAGENGWELASTQIIHSSLAFYIYKRPKQDK